MRKDSMRRKLRKLGTRMQLKRRIKLKLMERRKRSCKYRVKEIKRKKKKKQNKKKKRRKKKKMKKKKRSKKRKKKKKKKRKR